MSSPTLVCSIRPARPEDAAIITGFNRAMAKETEDKELDPAVAARGVERLLAKPDYGFYVVAEMDGEIVGSTMITYEWTDWRDGVFWWIQSVYVRPDRRGRGVYRALHAYIGAAAAKHPDARGLRLYVEKQNTTAQAAYVKTGMVNAGYELFEQVFVPKDGK